MYELFVFPNEIEHACTRQLVRHNFPLAELCDVVDPSEPQDLFMDFRLEISPGIFLQWAVETVPECGLPVVTYCYNLSMALTENPMPRWLVRELYAHPNLIDSITRQRSFLNISII
jgi:hypothetical protein